MSVLSVPYFPLHADPLVLLTFLAGALYLLGVMLGRLTK